jgi:CO/xanthine dehydrogenase Mo-binding subunit
MSDRVACNAHMKIVGRSIRRVDGVAKVNGQALYAGDVTMPQLLWGKALRSPHPSARILSIDTSRAAALPGVHAVLTGMDVPDTRYGRMYRDLPIITRDRVHFVGDRVAVVAAETLEIADAALQLIDVAYEQLPAVFDATEAMTDNAPRVHVQKFASGKLDVIPIHGEIRSYPEIPNVVSQLLIEQGDVAKAFHQAHHTFEHTFTIPSVHQGYLEPHACVIKTDEAGKSDVWMSHKSPHLARGMLAAALGITIDGIRLHQVMVGGDFGGKSSLMDAVVCYHLAAKTGRPVKMVMNYFEELTAAAPRHAASITLRTGLDRQNRLLAMSALMVFNTGGYAAFCPLPSLVGYKSFAGPYRVPNCSLDVRRVYTNTVPAGHMRSPGGAQINFAVESHIDMIACELGLDPIEFRHANALVEGQLSPIGDMHRGICAKEVIEAAMQKLDLAGPKKPNFGRGIALYEHPPGSYGISIVTITVHGNGRVTFVTGAGEQGGGFLTTASQIVADRLRVGVEDVEVIYGDTSVTKFDFGPSGSRLTLTISQAINSAAEKIDASLRELAAEYFGCDAAAVSLCPDGSFSTQGQSLTLEALMAFAAKSGKAPVSHEGQSTPDKPDDITCFAAQIAEVEVDPETGQVHVRKIIAAHDVGRVINPINLQGQIDGGVIQSLGQAMCENLISRDGAVVTASLGDYKLPSIRDIPELETVLVQASGQSDLAKGIGEISNACVAPAIANAIYDAVGVRITELPLSAEKIYAVLRDRARERNVDPRSNHVHGDAHTSGIPAPPLLETTTVD